MTWILTAEKQRFDLFDPLPSMVHEADIARALGNVCRFGGHCDPFYSVAQHSVLVYRICKMVLDGSWKPSKTFIQPPVADPSWHPREILLQALMHDAPEAYMGDITTPMKHGLPELRVLLKSVERPIWRAICERYGIREELHPLVKWADLVALATERRDLLPADEIEWAMLKGICPLPDRIQPMDNVSARYLFLNMLRAFLGWENGHAVS